MKRAIHIVTLLFIFYLKLFAVPSSPKSKIILQKDSSKIEVFLRGDEHNHFYFTSDNIPIAIGDDGSFYYVFLEKDKLKLSSFIAHEKNERKLSELYFIKEYSNNAITHLDYIRTQIKTNNENLRKTALKKNEFDNNRLFIGDKKGLVILVNFANKEMLPNANDTFNEMFNAIGYNNNNAVGSVHDYFYDQSYGQFNLTFDVVGPVTLSNNYGYYGTNGGVLEGNDMRPNEMVVEACQLADKFVDFSDYDWNGDGEVEQVFIVYAGYGESNGAPSNTIWPHKHNLEYTNSGIQNLDGTIINQYACSCELAGYVGTTLCGIGTACHEFSHCLGLPDFYDVDYNGGYGMGYWDIMSSGSHCGPDRLGEVPMGYSAYERQFCGWLNIKELDSPCVIDQMPSIGDKPVAYSIYNDNNRNEYFILENRQNTKWFSYVGSIENCHGMLIYHVDYDKSAWERHKINTDPNHQRYSIIPADMSLGKNSTGYDKSETELRGDLFPGLLNITELTNTSHDLCGGRLYNINTDGSFYMNKPLTNISEKDGFISFDFMGGIFVPIPQILEATDITNNSFTANWEEIENVDSYTLELSVLKPQGQPIENILISENFSRFKMGNNTQDGYIDLADNLDEYMQNIGWEGLKVFTSQYGVKLGTTTTNGNLVTPILNLKKSNITIRFTAKNVVSDDGTIQFELLTQTGKSIEIMGSRINNVFNQYIINFENIEEKFVKIKITSSERIYLSEISIFDGFYVKSDFDSLSEGNHMIFSDSVTIDNIIDNKYFFSDLNKNMYRYRVRANQGKARSGWSKYQEVTIEDNTGIKDMLYEKEEDNYLYNLNGIRFHSLPRQSSMYILKNSRKTIRIIK